MQRLVGKADDSDYQRRDRLAVATTKLERLMEYSTSVYYGVEVIYTPRAHVARENNSLIIDATTEDLHEDLRQREYRRPWRV